MISKMPEIEKISRFRVEKDMSGIYIDMDCILIYGCIIKETLKKAQINIIQDIERLTDLNIKRLDIVAKSLVVRSNKKGKKHDI